MIISASRRTDIPCFYGAWFVKRLQAGHCLVRHPMNANQIGRVSLSKDVVDCIVFWTKDAHPMMDQLNAINAFGIPYCFQYTVTPYGTDLERHVRPKNEIVENFRQLSALLGKHRVFWRYDPIIINENYTIKYHEARFAELCGKLGACTNKVTISFVDVYTKNNTKGIEAVSPEAACAIADVFGAIAQAHGIKIEACCEHMDLTRFGIAKGSCIDIKAIESVCGYRLAIKPEKGQRKLCGCAESIDIGTYGTCPNGCVYCYANKSAASAFSNYHKHDNNAALLSGEVGVARMIDRKQKSGRCMIEEGK